ncbi:BTAD domain-containing putative transcriptional regulator [Kutzneria sp. NPDC052558]|uniref:AfsR/SARP family transcriptional regulator n=1 Tax=Kutzneria sp. NPDC052558 TaxID=3364121 RepID=UPI0037C840DB
MADAAPDTLAVRLLGPPRATLDGHELPLGSPRQRALFAVLAMRANEVVYTEELIDSVWGEQLPGGPTGGVHTYVARLRRVLEPGRTRRSPGRILESHRAGYRLNMPADGVDVVQFERRRERGRRAWRDGDLGAAESAFTAALALFDGMVLGGVPGPFAESQRDQLTEQRLAVVEDRIDVLLAQLRPVEAGDELVTLTRDHPLRERPWAQLMLALYRQGRQADALSAFDRARAICAEELGLDPSPVLAELRQRIVVGDPALLAPPAASRLPVRCTLPRDSEDFTGRRREAAAIRALAGRRLVCVLDGMAGVGKTTLAVRLAHGLRERYPDAQLYLDLHGYASGTRPLDPAAALDKLLRVLDVPAAEIPAELDDRAALWRARLAERKALVVLDNAVDAAQVRPLLPGSPDALALVTSRRRLSGLDGAEFVTLDVLPRTDAVTLFGAIAGPSRPAAEPDVTEKVVTLCGFLPLAVQIAAAKLRHRPSWSVSHLLARLDDERHRLSELTADDRSVAAAFALSYRSLQPQCQRVFRLLSLFPGPEFALPAASALAGLDRRDTDLALQNLLDAHLLDEPQPDRFRLHDLLAVFSARQCQDEDSDGDRRAARTRLFEHYLYTVDSADNFLRPQRIDRVPGPVAPRHADRDQALDWLDAERGNLVPIVRAAAEHGFPRHAWQTARFLWGFYETRGHWADWTATHELALGCARQDGDLLAEARLLVGLGAVEHHCGRYDRAVERYLAALPLMREAGFPAGVAGVLNNLGASHRRAGRLDDAIACHEQSLTIFGETGDQRGIAFVLANLGELYVDAGRLTESADCLHRALAMFRESGSRRLEGAVLGTLARGHLAQNHVDEALVYGADALAAARDTGDRNGEAVGLDCLGRIHHRAGRTADALRHWRDALVIAEDIGSPLVEELRARLA